MSDAELARGTPGSVGVSSVAIRRFLDRAAQAGLELHSLMLFRRDRVIAEGWWAPYRHDRPHMMHSVAKSFTATAIGMATADGALRLDDKVAGFFPEARPADPGANLAAMTIGDLLTMRSGHGAGISGDAWRQLSGSWVAAFFDAPLPLPPGSRFVYSSGSSYMLAAILQRVTGERLHDYLDRRLFRPLAMSATTWDISPEGINPGGNGLACRTEDLIKLGILHLRQGVWNGVQILPADWVRAVSRSWVDHAYSGTPDAGKRGRGYGLHWWTGPRGAYYASGLFGQYSIVLPEQDAVLAVTGALAQGDQRLLDLVWDELAPALLSATLEDDGMLAARLAGLELAQSVPGPASPTAGRVSGQVFHIASNEDGVREIAFGFTPGRCLFQLTDARGPHAVEVGLAAPVEGLTTMTGGNLHHQYEPEQMRVVAAGRWIDALTFAMTWRFVETAFCDTVICRFDGDELTLDRSVNVNSGALARPRLVCRAA